MKNSNQSAFPEVKTDPAWNDGIYSNTYSVGGLTKREYFLCHLVYEPSKTEIDLEITRDRNKNPHNDPHKPPLRSYDEIIAYLKLKKVDTLLAALDSR